MNFIVTHKNKSLLQKDFFQKWLLFPIVAKCEGLPPKAERNVTKYSIIVFKISAMVTQYQCKKKCYIKSYNWAEKFMKNLVF